MRTRGPLLTTTLAVLLVVGAAVPSAGAVERPAAVPDAASSATGTSTTHDVTVVMLTPEGTAPDYTRDEALHSLAVVDAFYANETDGAVRLRVVAATDWLTMPTSVDCTDFDPLVEYGRKRAGFVGGADRHLLVMTPEGSGCVYALGQQASTLDAGGVATVATTDPTTIAHELGHTMSLQHTSSVRCASRWDLGSATGLPSSCTRDEYGNVSDIMGGGSTFYPFTAVSLAHLGALRHPVVLTCGAPRRITVSTMSAPSSAQRVVTWRNPAHPGVAYYLQFRDVVDNLLYAQLYPSPRAAQDDAPTGIEVTRTDPREREGGSVLTRPGDSSNGSRRIRAGERVPLDDGMSVQAVSFDGTAHTATVDVAVPCARPATGTPDEALRAAPAPAPAPAVVRDRIRA